MGSSAATSSYHPPPFFTKPFNPTVITFFLLFFPFLAISGPVYFNSISPNFTATNLQFIDNSGPGAFLASQNNSFQARITNEKPESKSYYFVVVHVASNTIVWSANRNTPISQSSELRFSSHGLTLYNDSGQPIWSTPENLPSVSSLQLLESGNLVLLDFTNNTVWESFDYPTDLIVAGQKLRVAKSLVSSLSAEDLSEGSYKFVVGDGDAMLQWNGLNYWKLSMDPKAFRELNFAVEYMVMNFSGVYLIGKNDDETVIKITLQDSNDVNSSSFWIAKLDYNGFFSIVKINSMDGSNEPELKAPANNCRIPFICGKLGVCTNGGSCQCAPGFRHDPKMINGDCLPADSSLDLPSGTCSGNDTTIEYLNLRKDLDYFLNDFANPVISNVNLSVCQNLCSRNCSCFGFFYTQNSGLCNMIMNYLGSFLVKSSSSSIDTSRLGYIKTVMGANNPSGKNSDFPVLAVVLLPSSGIIAIAIVATLILLRRRSRRRKRGKSVNSKLARGNYSFSSAEDETEFVSIPGLPVRLDYKELALATDDFKNQIGSGGFGTVYKGTLENRTDVAVKKITCLGSQGKREFLTEIAVIGKIHHVNLVRLKGFSADRGQRFLVYEFMNRGSLDKTLFRDEPVLEWRERFEIALGTAKGLAYLHTGCEHKIIHCDIKPENILLHDNNVKISDFGLSKLLSPEESGLFTTMRGTRGYLAPEWLTSSAISDRTDVYSYGMVLLEIIRGKKNNDGNEGGAQNAYFPLFALEMHEEGRYLELVDPRLGGRVTGRDVEKLVKVALCCVHQGPNLRPSMSNVVGMLEGVMPLGEPRIESLKFLRFHGSRFNEASRLDGGGNEENELDLYRQQMNSSTSSGNSYSYMSSQQVSGPR